MSEFTNKWNHFWFENVSVDTLCLIRIFTGITFLIKLTVFLPLLREGVLSITVPKYTFYDPNIFHLEGFRNAVPGFEWLPVPSFALYQNIELVLIILGLLFTLGLFTRYAATAIALIYSYILLISQFNYHHHVFLFVIVFWIISFSKCYSRYSLDSYSRLSKPNNVKGMILPYRILQVLVSIVYLFSVLNKCNEGWLTGSLMYIYYQQGTVSGVIVDTIDKLFAFSSFAPYKELFWKSLGPATLAIEAILIFGLWVPALRRLSIFLGIILHASIFMMMNVETFSFQMWVLYIAFLYPKTETNIVCYNNKHLNTIRFVKLCKLLDWFKRIKWQPVTQSVSMTAINNNNKFFAGTPAFVFITGLLPGTFIFSYILGLFYSMAKRS